VRFARVFSRGFGDKTDQGWLNSSFSQLPAVEQFGDEKPQTAESAVYATWFSSVVAPQRGMKNCEQIAPLDEGQRFVSLGKGDHRGCATNE
jgi:hypothetical protein